MLHPRLRLGHHPTLHHQPSSSFLAPLPGSALKLHKKICPRQLYQCLSIFIIKQFSGAVAGDFGAAARGVPYSQSLYFVFVLLRFFSCLAYTCLKKFNPTKISVVFIHVLLVCLVLCLFLMATFFETRSCFTEDQHKIL